MNAKVVSHAIHYLVKVHYTHYNTSLTCFVIVYVKFVKHLLNCKTQVGNSIDNF